MSKEKTPGNVPMGKSQYRMVVARVNDFRTNAETANWTIKTEEILHQVGVCASFKTTILDDEGRERGNGHAWDAHNHSPKHGKSYYELAETSSIGRALANIGLAGSDEYASADEVFYAMQTVTGELNVDQAPEERPVNEPPVLHVVETKEPDPDRKKVLNEQFKKYTALAKEVKKPTFEKHMEKFKKSLSEDELTTFQPYINQWMKNYES